MMAFMTAIGAQPRPGTVPLSTRRQRRRGSATLQSVAPDGAHELGTEPIGLWAAADCTAPTRVSARIAVLLYNHHPEVAFTLNQYRVCCFG
jgi:hypothetical protein